MALANAEAEFTGSELARRVGRRTHQGALNVLERLVEQGIVLRRQAGRANLYSLNRDHLAAPWIERLAGLRQQLLERMRKQVAEWPIQPVVAAVFGSVARGEAGSDSDVDILLVRPTGVDEEDWDAQVSKLTAAVTRWTGNDAQPLEFAEEELAGVASEPVIKDVVDHGIEVGGSLQTLRRLARG